MEYWRGESNLDCFPAQLTTAAEPGHSMSRDTTGGGEKRRIPGKKNPLLVETESRRCHAALEKGGWFSWVTAGREGKEEEL